MSNEDLIFDLVEQARQFNQKEFNRLSNSMNVLYSRKLNDRIEVFLGQMVQHQHGFEFNHSNHMAIIVVDYKTYRHIGMRLSTFRKLFTFVADKNWKTSRHLNWIEKRKLNKQWPNVCERLMPGFKKHHEENKTTVKEIYEGSVQLLNDLRKKKLEDELNKELNASKKSQKRVDKLTKRLEKINKG